MKRYEPKEYTGYGGDPICIEYDACSDGTLVKYDEAAAIERQRDRAVELLRQLHKVQLGGAIMVNPDGEGAWWVKRNALLAEIDASKYRPTEDTGETD